MAAMTKTEFRRLDEFQKVNCSNFYFD